MTSEIAIVDSGAGNLHSVEKALARSGGRPRVTSDPEVVRRADKIVVPGQGAFADCAVALRERGLGDAIREVIAAGRPYLGICLGLQILFDSSEEHGPVAGLGILPGRVVRFSTSTVGGAVRKVPHIGWNSVHATRPEPLLAGVAAESYLYFTHSFVAEPDDPALVALECDYGGRFCAAVRRDNVFACQFHPEKSQAVGLQILANFVAADRCA